MNKLQKLIAALAIGVGCFAIIALGQVLKPLPLPATWAAANGNYFRLTSAAGTELRVGTNTYSGATTNISLFGGSTNQVRLRVVNGVVAGVVAE